MSSEGQSLLDKVTTAEYVILYDDSTADLARAGPNPLYHTLMKFYQSGKVANKLGYLYMGFQNFETVKSGLVCRKAPDERETDAPVTPGLIPGPATQFNLRPVITSLKVSSPGWGHASPATVAPVDDTRISIPDSVWAAVDLLPQSLRNIVRETQEGRNPIADNFAKLQASEQARLSQAYSREPKSAGVSARLTPGSRMTSASTISPSRTPLTAGNDVEYTFCTSVDTTKNRYSNIRPYDHSRVRTENHGYMNASYVGTSFSKLRYIATQAPVPNSLNDFWQVVFDHQVPVIVMLTELATKGGQIKSHKYWDLGFYGDVEVVKVDEESVQEHELLVRHITLEKHGVTHKLAQMQYTVWTDLGRPRSVEDVITLVDIKSQLMDHYKIRQDYSDWVLVHCSAGCGRTGTFCIIDSVIDYYKSPIWKDQSESHDPIYESVDELRRQRLGMVQVQRQYSLCYEVVIMWYLRYHLRGHLMDHSPKVAAPWGS